jgi:membrane-bound metal-dependent hydrolase YbcI (DUF457 family)
MASIMDERTGGEELFSMRTYSHFLLTAVIGERLQHRLPVRMKALLLGAVLPDVLLLLLTLGYMAYRHWLDPLQLHEPIYGPRYDALYFHSPVWITAHSVLHAPLLIALIIGLGYLGWRQRTAWGFAWLWFGIGCGLHSLTDILTHHNDGPLLLFPLDWTLRLASPMSYWDARYHGDAVALAERVLDLCILAYLAIGWLWRRRASA